jgi:formylglycine-generating enzyme required for sulfatase activity
MAGNEAEWTADWYAKEYYATSPPTDPTGPDKPQNWKVVRGGSYKDVPARLRVSARFGISPFADSTGVRCTLDTLP